MRLTDLSPKPCSMITVAVCFLAGATISGGAEAILCNASSLLNGIYSTVEYLKKYWQSLLAAVEVVAFSGKSFPRLPSEGHNEGCPKQRQVIWDSVIGYVLTNPVH